MRDRRYALIVFTFLAVIFALSLSACSSAQPHAKQKKQPSTTTAVSSAVKGLTVPPGFHIQIYARGLEGPRFMTVAPNGDLLVSETDAGRVVAVPRPLASPEVVASNLTLPHGIAMRGPMLYVATWSGIQRMQYPGGRLWVEVAGFPHNSDHYRRALVVGPDGNLYVSLGASCNVCDDQPPLAQIKKELPGGALVTFATGVRNAGGLAFDSAGRMWATIDQRDNIGPTQTVTDDLPPDELDLVKAGANFGWPSCYPDPHQSKRDPNPEYPGADCSHFTPATFDIRPHASPLGIVFYNKTMFPPQYRGGAFVALHGSWDRRVPVGDKVMYVAFASGKPTKSTNFITGWLVNGRYTGRPVGVTVGRDGSLFVSDDQGGLIYRVTYGP
jgi:glucose/arabinose dehydrogenase